MSSTAHAQPIQVGIAGLGRSGWGIHARALSDLTDLYQIAAVSDPDPARCDEAVQQHGCRVHKQAEDLFRDPALDLVVIATPNRLHAQHAITALRAGRHVVCEKPMALRATEADEMIAAAQETGRTLAPFQNLRYRPDFLKVREVIEAGVLGRIVQIRICRHAFGRRWDWQTLREFGGGELNNTGPHLIDQALELLGPGEPEVFYHCDRALTLGDAEDHAKVVLRVPGQPLVEIEVTRASAYPPEAWLVMGTSGGLHGTTSTLTWKYVDFSKMPERHVDSQPTPDRSYNKEPLDWTEQTWSAPEMGPREPEQHFYRDLYETLRHGKPQVITPESVRRQLAVIERCHEMADALLQPAAASS